MTSSFEPRNPDYENIIRASFERQRVMQFIGARLDQIRPGHVSIRLPYAQNLTQQNGFLHAGIITTIADSAGGYAALSLMPPGADVLSVEFKVNLMSPAIGDYFVAEADVIRSGRTLTVCQSNVYAIRDRDVKKHCAAMQMTLIQVPMPDEKSN